MDEVSKDSLVSAAVTAGGIIASIETYKIQENVYGRPNALKPISELLGNPDYLTSFVYPLTLMFAMRTICKVGESYSKITNSKNQELFFKLSASLVPFLVMGLNIWHEIESRPSYKDNPAIDMLAGCIAGLTYIMTTDTKKDIGNALNKIFKSDTQNKFPEMKDTEVLEM